MHADGQAASSDGVSRRRVLRGLGAGSAITLGGVAGCQGSGSDSTPTETDSGATFVLSTAQSGPYSDIGAEEQRGFELAVDHINQGGGFVDSDALSLDGSGLLDQQVDTATVDTGSDPDTARSAVEPYTGDTPASLLVGGIAGSVVRELRSVAGENGVVYFPGLSTLDGVSGGNCSSAVYRETYNTSTLIRALGSAIGDRFGSSISYYQLHVDAPEGRDLFNAVNDHFPDRTDAGWEGRGDQQIRPGSTSFESAINGISAVLPDVLFVDLFGLDAANAIQQIRAALEDVIIVVPVLDQTVASTVGADIEGVVGTAPWHPAVPAETAGTFADAYRAAHGDDVTPTGPARTAYAQTILFADAAESANGYASDAVKSELEDRQYDLGLGSETLRACDHQAARPVPIVRGKADTAAPGGWLELDSVQEGVTPGCDESPASDCSF
ncbi:MAG: ABC transporter substrate-binding protein [Haloarculaceae archaeon]